LMIMVSMKSEYNKSYTPEGFGGSNKAVTARVCPSVRTTGLGILSLISPGHLSKELNHGIRIQTPKMETA
jgi:hypothetical protein